MKLEKTLSKLVLSARSGITRIVIIILGGKLILEKLSLWLLTSKKRAIRKMRGRMMI